MRGSTAGAFLRDTLRGLRQAVDVLSAGPGRDSLAALVGRIGRVVADPQADRERCLRDTREALGPLAESTADDLRAAADRTAWVTGLRDLADFLAAHRDLPVPPAHHTEGILMFPDGGTDDERRAGVDQAAGVLGVRAADRGGHYRASRRFGPVEYVAVMIPRPGQTAAAAELTGAAA